MEHKSDSPDMKDRILARIQKEHLAMRPHLYFSLQIAAVIVVTVLVLAVSVFIFNFILFHIRINHHYELLGFGPRGAWAFPPHAPRYP